MKSNSLLTFLLMIFFINTFAQKLNFTEVWVWEYTNLSGQKSEMAVYREPQSNYWLLTAESFGSTDEMTEWFVIKPNGEVLQKYQDAELNTLGKLIIHQIKIPTIQKLPTHWKKGKGIQYFGKTDLGFPKFKGTKYNVQYEKTNEQSEFYLGKTQANFQSLSLFNELNIEAKIPIQFPKNIPSDYLVLSEQTTFSDGVIAYEFRYISHTEYYIDIGK